jgi:hypothetical protein
MKLWGKFELSKTVVALDRDSQKKKRDVSNWIHTSAVDLCMFAKEPSKF